jgi:ATP-dependent helicase/nuclease subunit B
MISDQPNPTMLQPAPFSVTFGLRYDVAPPTAALPTLGQATVGPLGLLQLLETRLGLKRVDASLAERREQYRQLLEQAPEEAFFRSSLAKDPIATAATLLQWRDGLVEAGWDGQADAADSLRLRGLAEVENRV